MLGRLLPGTTFNYVLQKMTEVNNAKKLVRKMPTESQLREFIDQAKSLPPAAR